MSRQMPDDFINLYSTMFSTHTDGSMDAVPEKKFDKNEAIKSVRTMLETKAKTLMLPQLDDNFILRFLNARKMNIEAAFQLIVNYFTYRKSNQNLFLNHTVNDNSIQNCLQDGLPMVLKSRDRKGRCVLLFLIYQWDHSKYTIESIYRSLLLTIEYLLEDKQNQVNGFVFVVDWSNFKLRDYVDLSPKMLKLMIDGFQDSFPAKIKGFHFIGQPWYVDGILTVVKSFLKDKTKQKFIVHGTNLSNLHEYLPRDVVTPELGGEGTAYRTDEWIQTLKAFEERSTNE